MLYIKSLLWGTMGILMVMVGTPYLILRSAHGALSFDIGWLRWLGLVPMAAGFSLLAYTFFSLVNLGKGTPSPLMPTKQLVVKGPFAWVRNPAYVAAVTMIAGEAVVLQSFWILIQAAAMFLAFHIFVTLWEEPDLRARFGESYLEYCRNVPRWIPRLGH